MAFSKNNLTLSSIYSTLKFVRLFIIVLIMVIIVVTGMVPAVLTNDPAKVQEAADRTTERILDFTIDRVVDEVKGLPLEIITDKLPE